MAETPPRKPPVGGSRAPGARPRRLAGSRPPPTTPPAEGVMPIDPVTSDAPLAQDGPVDESLASAELPDASPAERPVEESATADSETGSLPEPAPDQDPASRVVLTVGLVMAALILVAVAVLEGFYLWGQGDAAPSTAAPVRTDEVTTAATLDTAAKATQLIVAADYRTYDKQVDAAARTMTDAFAAQYRQTKGDIEDKFVAAKTVVDAQVTGQAVMSASDSQVKALVLLDQLVTTGTGPLTTTPYRALVTLVDTPDGWLVSSLELT